MKKNTKKTTYSEPAEYFPKSIRKELKIGEFAEKKTETKKTETKKKVKRK